MVEIMGLPGRVVLEFDLRKDVVIRIPLNEAEFTLTPSNRPYGRGGVGTMHVPYTDDLIRKVYEATDEAELKGL